MPEYNEPGDHPMDEIAKQFKVSDDPSPGLPDPQAASRMDQPTSADGKVYEIKPEPSANPTFGPLSLSADTIAAPAFFVNRNLSLHWIAPNGSDAFSQALVLERESASTRNIFSLLLGTAVKGSLSDWQAVFSFVYILLRRSTSPDIFDSGTVFVSSDHTPTTDTKTSGLQDIHPFQVDSCIIGGRKADGKPPLRIFGMGFDEGTLFLIRQDTRHLPETGERDKISAVATRDVKNAICILSARLNDSHRIADTMLPELFFKLMSQVRDEADDVVRALGGTRTASSGAEIQYIFSESAGRNPIFSAICCSTRLNRRMQALKNTLTEKQGWADEICMNMGISNGTDDLTAPEPTGAMELMIPGGASDQSSLLSAIAEKGEIWITRNAIEHLPKKHIDQVVLGVDRQGQFLRNFFIRLSDLPRDIGTSPQKVEMDTLSVARIVKIERQGQDQPLTKED